MEHLSLPGEPITVSSRMVPFKPDELAATSSEIHTIYQNYFLTTCNFIIVNILHKTLTL